MREASWHWFLLLLFVLVTRSAYGADNKLSDTLKNMTQSKNTTNGSQNGEENLLKAEIRQYLRECGANLPEDEANGQRFTNNNRSNYNYDFKNRRYSNNYDDGNYENRRNYWNQNGNSNNGNAKRNGYRNDNSNNENCDDGNSGDSQNSYSNYAQNGYNMMGRLNYGNNRGNTHGDYRYGNCNYESNGYSYGGGGQDGNGYNRGNNNNNNGNRGTYDLNYGNRNPSNEQGNSGNGYGNNNFMDKRQRGNWNDNGDGSYFRGKRSEGSAQCISQCVFGYLEVLDDSRVPSETLLIKWLQDHLTNDIKRIRALREARRCFARLATTDTEDGCEFSKSLSNCLDLDIE